MTYRPKRIAPPRLILDAASALAGQVEASRQIGDDDRDRYYNAITKAVGQLMDGCRYEQAGDEMIFSSRTRSGISHRVNGRCDCEAGEKGDPCWHRAASRIIAMVEEIERETLVTPPPAPPPCPRCGTTMYIVIDMQCRRRHTCPACQHSRLAPVDPPRERPAISAAQAQAEIDELYY